MPNPKDFDTEKDFMRVCVPTRIKEGDKPAQASAICHSIWRNKDKKSNALKAVLESPYELVIENHIVLFGGRDATGAVLGKNPDGSSGEFFTKATDLESEYTQSGTLHVDFEHGFDPDDIGNDKNNILGIVDWKTAKADDDGVIVRRVLNRRHKYMKWLEPLIRAGLVGNSSESIGGQAEKSATGEITKWPLKRDTLTVNPMEPRMLEENVLSAIKALTEDFPQYKSLFPPDAALPDKDVAKKNMEIKTMDENEIKATVAQAVAAELAKFTADQKAEAEKQAAIKAAEDAKYEAGYKKALEDVKDKKAPAFNTVPLGFSEEKDAVPGFCHWMKTGQPNGALIQPSSTDLNIKAAFNISDGATGGYLVPDPLLDRIIAKRDLASWVRQAPCQFFSTEADHILVPIEATSATAFTLTAEAAAYTEEEATLDQIDLALLKYTKVTKVSEEFLAGKNSNFESWLTGALGRAAAITENTVATAAILSGANAATVSAAANATAAEIARLIGSLSNGYNTGAAECGFLMKNATKWFAMGLATGSGPFAFIATPASGGTGIYGYPAYVSDDMAAQGSGTIGYLFANFWYFGVCERPGMLVQRNPYLYMANGQVGIFANIYRAYHTLQTEAVYTMAGT